MAEHKISVEISDGLRKSIDNYLDPILMEIKRIKTENEELRAENDRLRRALKAISCGMLYPKEFAVKALEVKP